MKKTKQQRQEENPLDYYGTPAFVTQALLANERIAGPIWEPACGRGHIARLLPGKVVATDLGDWGYGQGGVNFLTTKAPKGVKSIITNPPYHQAHEFIRRAMTLPGVKNFYFLMQTGVMNLPSYFPFKEGLRKIYTLSGDPLSFELPDGTWSEPHKLWGYSWYCWQRGYTGPTTVDYIQLPQTPRAPRVTKSSTMREFIEKTAAEKGINPWQVSSREIIPFMRNEGFKSKRWYQEIARMKTDIAGPKHKQGRMTTPTSSTTTRPTPSTTSRTWPTAEDRQAQVVVTPQAVVKPRRTIADQKRDLDEALTTLGYTEWSELAADLKACGIEL